MAETGVAPLINLQPDALAVAEMISRANDRSEAGNGLPKRLRFTCGNQFPDDLIFYPTLCGVAGMLQVTAAATVVIGAGGRDPVRAWFDNLGHCRVIISFLLSDK